VTCHIWTGRFVLQPSMKSYERSTPMRLTIFGATGGTGKSLVEQALAAGHEITAVVRDPTRLPLPPQARLHMITADVMDPVAIAPAVDGADAVLTALGPRGTGPTSISEDSTRSIIEAMEKSGARRLITVSGSIVDDAGDGFFMHRVMKPLARRTFLRNVSADMRCAEDLVHSSNLDWTIFRPPRLTNKPASGRYRTAVDRNPPRGVTISRADLAAEMLEHLDDPATWHKHVFIAN
jgi:putative NADH-flavin reductase